MPWCPKCKNEYQDGYKVCTDCGCELVESMVDRSVMEDMVLCLLEEEDAKKCLDFLHFAKIDTAYISFEEDEDTYAVMVGAGQASRARSLFREYREEMLNNSGVEESPVPPSGNKIYIKKEEQHKEIRSSGYLFLVVGIAGICFVLSAIADIIHLNLDPVMKYIFYIVLSILFIVFTVIGFTSIGKAKKLKKDAEEENQQIQRIIQWFEKELTRESVDACINALEHTPAEVLYFSRSAIIKDKILEFSPDIGEGLSDALTEDIYTRLYEES